MGSFGIGSVDLSGLLALDWFKEKKCFEARCFSFHRKRVMMLRMKAGKVIGASEYAGFGS
jgi:hypothetical protein